MGEGGGTSETNADTRTGTGRRSKRRRPSITAVPSLSTGVLTVWGKEVGHCRQTQIPGQGQDALASIAELVVKKSEIFSEVLSVDNQRSIKLCQKKL